MPEIGPDTVPGAVLMPTWLVALAIGGQWLWGQVKDHKGSAALVAAAATVNELTAANKALTEAVGKSSEAMKEMKSLVERVLDEVKRSKS